MRSADRVSVFAPAKLNLCLHVGERRTDGYHDVESLVAFVALGDNILLERSESSILSLGGPFGAGLSGGADNLALRAARLLAEKANVRSGARISLQKEIPVAAGLGGGSADAAAVLRGLAQLWNLPIDAGMLHELAASLGADVAVCLASAAAWIEGRGERVTVLPALPKIHVLLVNPGVPVSTPAVFASLRRRRGIGLDCPRRPFGDAHALVQFLRTTGNDLEAPARAIAPAIGEVIEEISRLPDVLLARMSGSGATCFGLFENPGALEAARDSLLHRHPDWWIAGTALATAGQATPTAAQ